MIGFPLGLLAANAGEWWVHKHILHGVGKTKGSFWSFHWREHHAHSRKLGFRDPDYERSPLGWHAQGKEVYALLGVSAACTVVAPVAPWFCMGVWTHALGYYLVHRKSHLDPEWARKHLPWHYDHHMGPNQDANWCVTYPLWDYLMNTREPYLGTERELRDRERASRRSAGTVPSRVFRAVRA